MLTASSQFLSALDSNNRIWKLKVEITRNDIGAPSIDISDRINSTDITFDYERRSGRAGLEIDNYDYLLSPLNRDSVSNQVGGVYNPLFDSNHIVKIYEGLLTSNGYEYIHRFTGVLGDEIDADTYPGTIQLTARDRSKLLQDTYLYQSKTYHSMVVEQVMQDMLNEFALDLGITIQVASATLFMIGRPDKPYTAKNTNLWDALQLLADACNHELRFLEDGSLSLKKVERELDTITPVKIFNESQLVKDSMSLSDSDIRNHIKLRVQGLDPVEKKNDDSISKYGRRYMEVHRSMSNVISTLEQAHDFVDNLLKDLSYVTPNESIELPLYPLIQVGDIVAVNNAKLGTREDYDIFRITSVRDSYSNNKKRTNLNLEGYIKFTIADSIAPKAPVGLTHQMIERVIQNYPNSGWVGSEKTTYFPMIQWDAVVQDINNTPLDANFGGYTIYRKHSSETIWYPVSSIKSYIGALNLLVDYFYDYTAQSGSNSYKIVAINILGKKSAESSIYTIIIPSTTTT